MKKANWLYLTTFIIRIFVIVLTIFLIYNGFGVYTKTKETSLLMYSNLTPLLFWVVFMMGAIIISPLGRFFCTICPAGEINYLFSKSGLNKPLNLSFSFLQGLSLIAVFILVIVFHFSRQPHLTSLLVLFVLILAAVMGLIFKGNSFCLLICPANAFLRFYSRLSVFKTFCKNGAKPSSCMVFLNPCNINKEQCHLCFRCFKNAEGLTIHRDKTPFENLLKDFKTEEIFIFTVLSGLTIMAFIRVVSEAREMFVYPPYLLSLYLHLDEKYLLLIVTFFGVFVYPALFYTIFVLPFKFIKKASFLNLAKTYLPLFIPQILSVHMILAVTKLNARLGFLPYAILEPSGKDMVQLFSLGKLEIPADLISVAYIKYLILFIPLAALILSFYMIKGHLKIFAEKMIAGLNLALFFLFTEYCVIKWLFRGLL